jgi:hypothetical protein
VSGRGAADELGELCDNPANNKTTAKRFIILASVRY